MQKVNIAMDRAQRGDGKNVVICLVIMFTSKVIVIKMPKMADCLFCQWQQKKITIWANAYEKSYSVLSRMVCFRVTVKWP